jgi:hypothetical protein
LNLFPHGETAADLAKMFAQFFCENRFLQQKTRFLPKSDRIITAKSSYQKKSKIAENCDPNMDKKGCLRIIFLLKIVKITENCDHNINKNRIFVDFNSEK